MYFTRIAAVIAALLIATTAADAEESDLQRGEYLVAAGGCIDCHTDTTKNAVPFGGGRAIESPFGTFYSPNITADVATGIGAWSDDDFVAAFWEGVSPDGDHYYPVFPYTSYTGVARSDLLAMKQYLFSLEPVSRRPTEHELAWYLSTRMAAGAWKLANFGAGRFVPDPGATDEWNRGAYLVRHLGHCGECHTPRSSLGVSQNDKEFAGNPNGPDEGSAPNITTHQTDGIGKWSVSDIEYFLDIGMLPDGDFVGSSMSDVIDNNTSKLTLDDRLAIATYLKSVSPHPL